MRVVSSIVRRMSSYFIFVVPEELLFFSQGIEGKSVCQLLVEDSPVYKSRREERVARSFSTCGGGDAATVYYEAVPCTKGEARGSSVGFCWVIIGDEPIPILES